MKTKTPPLKKMTAKQRLDTLTVIIGICFTLLEDKDFKEVSNLTGLSLSTIHRLYNGEYTLNVRWGTIQALGIAAGLEITSTPYQSTVRLVK